MVCVTKNLLMFLNISAVQGPYKISAEVPLWIQFTLVTVIKLKA